MALQIVKKIVIALKEINSSFLQKRKQKKRRKREREKERGERI